METTQAKIRLTVDVQKHWGGDVEATFGDYGRRAKTRAQALADLTEAIGEALVTSSQPAYITFHDRDGKVTLACTRWGTIHVVAIGYLGDGKRQVTCTTLGRWKTTEEAAEDARREEWYGPGLSIRC